MKQITKKYKGYNVEIDDRQVKINGKRIIGGRRIALTFGNKEIQKEIQNMTKNTDPETLRNMGAEVYETREELLENVLGDAYDKETIQYIEDGMDVRTRSYLHAIEENIGFKEMRTGWEGVDIDIEYHLNGGYGLTGSGEIDCGKDAHGNWWAQFSYRTGIDDYVIESYRFISKPSLEMVKTAGDIQHLKLDIDIGGFPISFRCWECGNETHWLDVTEEGTPPNLERRIEMAKENYCGC